jgi:hypothetical protein
MGGEAFKSSDGTSLTTGIKREQVLPTLNALLRDVLKPAGVESYTPLGSTGKKSISGDLDIAVGPFPVGDPKKLKAIKDGLLKNIQQIVGADKAKLVGQNIAIMHQISGNSNAFVQVDVMLSGDPQKTGWLMSGTGEGVKGVYRNLLLSFLAKLRSEENPGTKITISFPGGIQAIKDGEVIVARTEDPKAIIYTLKIPGDSSDITTFEGLVDILLKDKSVSERLEGFELYISRYLQDSHTAVEASKAIEAINTARGLNEATRSKTKSMKKLLESLFSRF